MEKAPFSSVLSNKSGSGRYIRGVASDRAER
jgi:hypothetical protein